MKINSHNDWRTKIIRNDNKNEKKNDVESIQLAFESGKKANSN